MATTVGSLMWRLGLDNKALRTDAKKAQGILGKMSTGFLGSISPVQVGIAGIGIAFARAGKAAIDFSKDYETAFAEVQTISDQAVENADAMKESILDMTSRIPVGAIDSTKALYQIVSAGFDGADAMNVLEASAKAAVAGVTTTAVAADTLTTIINAYGKEAGDVTQISDALFQTVKLGKTTLSEIGSSFAQVAPLAATYGIELNQVLAALATMTKQGTPTSEAITGIRQAIVSVTEKMGEGAFRGKDLVQVFDEARTAAKDGGGTMREYFGRIQAVGAVLQTTGKNLDTYRDSLDQTNKSAGTSKTAFEIIKKTVEAQETLLKNNLKNILKNFGDFITSMESDIIPKLNALFTTPEEKVAEGVKTLAGSIKEELKGIEDETKAREFAIKKLGELEEKTRELNKKIAEGEKESAGKFTFFGEAGERLSRALGLGGKFTEGIDFKDYITFLEGQRDVIRKTTTEIADLFSKGGIFEGGIKPEGEKPELDLDVKIIPPSIADIKKDIDKLQDKFDAATSDEDRVEILAKITVKQEDVKKIYDDLREAVKDVSPGKIKPIEAELLTPITTVQGLKKSKEVERILKNLPKLIREFNAETKESKTEDLANGIFDASAAMGELSVLAGTFDDELGDALAKTADMGIGVANMVEGLAKGGDPVQAIAGGVQILTALFDDSARKQADMQDRAENLSQTIEIQNRKLERQIEILKELSGIERTKGEQEYLAEVQKGIDKLNKSAQDYDLTVKKTERGFLSKSTTKITAQIDDINDLRDALDGVSEKGDFLEDLIGKGFNIENLDQLNELVDQYDSLIEKRQQLFEELTQTTTEGIAQTLADGFAAGKFSMEDFANDFESLMKNAMIESFKTQTLLAASKGFFDKFAELSRGGLTEAEIAILQGDYSKLIENSQEQFNALNEVFSGAFGGNLFDDVDSATSGLAGSIGRAISEDTSIRFIGTWNRIQDETILHTSILQLSNDNLIAINSNTLRTAEAVEELNSKITTNDGRGTGIQL